MITFYSFKDFQSLLVKESVCCQDYNLNIQLANAAYFNLMYSIESALNFSMNDSMRVKHNYFKVNRIAYLSRCLMDLLCGNSKVYIDALSKNQKVVLDFVCDKFNRDIRYDEFDNIINEINILCADSNSSRVYAYI
jgi:hypothetical protein